MKLMIRNIHPAHNKRQHTKCVINLIRRFSFPLSCSQPLTLNFDDSHFLTQPLQINECAWERQLAEFGFLDVVGNKVVDIKTRYS